MRRSASIHLATVERLLEDKIITPEEYVDLVSRIAQAKVAPDERTDPNG